MAADKLKATLDNIASCFLKVLQKIVEFGKKQE